MGRSIAVNACLILSPQVSGEPPSNPVRFKLKWMGVQQDTFVFVLKGRVLDTRERFRIRRCIE